VPRAELCLPGGGVECAAKFLPFHFLHRGEGGLVAHLRMRPVIAQSIKSCDDCAAALRCSSIPFWMLQKCDRRRRRSYEQHGDKSGRRFEIDASVSCLADNSDRTRPGDKHRRDAAFL